MRPTSTQIPKCRLCGQNHFARETCKFGSMSEASHAMDVYNDIARIESVRTKIPARKPATSPTVADQTTADKATPGKRKTAQRKGKKK